MLKAVYPVLALLALLFAAVVGSWNVAPAGEHAEHVASHDLTSIDDGDDGDDAIVSSTLAPPGADDDDDRDDTDGEGEGDGSAIHRMIGAIEFPPLGIAGALSMPRRGLLPSGEHRAGADRPPRA